MTEETVGLRPTPRPSPQRAEGLRRSPRHGHPRGYAAPTGTASHDSLVRLPAQWRPPPGGAWGGAAPTGTASHDSLVRLPAQWRPRPGRHWDEPARAEESVVTTAGACLPPSPPVAPQRGASLVRRRSGVVGWLEMRRLRPRDLGRAS